MIFWPMLCAGIIIFVIMFWRIRDRIDPKQRDKIENIMIAAVLVLLLIDIGIGIIQRADEGRSMNDCIAFYRYFPGFEQPEEYSFFFLDKCKEYFSDEEIENLRKAGYSWNEKNIEKGLFSKLNLSQEVKNE